MTLHIDRSNDTLTLRLRGEWSLEQAQRIERELATLPASGVASVRVDCAELARLDLSAAWMMRNALEKLRAQGAVVGFEGARPDQFAFIDDITQEKSPTAFASGNNDQALTAAVAALGKLSVKAAEGMRAALRFYGRVLVSGVGAMAHPKRLRFPSIARHVYETGVQAVPIVALIAFLITLVIAYIGAQQLERFGAEIFTVDLVVVGVLREMGVLLTAIIVAGRSGSAFAAELGVMQLNDEVDALKSIGMDPYEVLVVPRVLGLIIALPLLTILADTMGLAGGALLCSWLLDISIPQFVSRMQDALAPTTFWAGFLKAPAFAFLIAMTGTFRGMQVRDSSRELGRLTTVAVVQSIFLVILANAVFAVIYLELEF
jgi:phospholipid/cholesterol/gamma-HCH transport system permease protein